MDPNSTYLLSNKSSKNADKRKNVNSCGTKSFIKVEGSGTLWENGRSRRLSLDLVEGERGVSIEDGFPFVVSLQNGRILNASKDISNHLGYSKDMVVGKSFMNFLFEKDHITFTQHLSRALNTFFVKGKKRDSFNQELNTFFCRLRIHEGLQLGYSVSEQKNVYKPFKITLHTNEVIVDNVCVGTLGVKATASHVSSAYSVPEEISPMPFFSTRHTASCHFSQVDESAIPFLGYLPQDMIGCSVFEFYHADDMPQLKVIYEFAIQEEVSSFRSEPYRFKVQNGSFILLETEWACYTDPWSHKLEFVIGQHRVLKGPSDINIFAIPEIAPDPEPEKNIKESQLIQKEITAILSQSMQAFETEKSKRFSNKRKGNLEDFVLTDEPSKVLTYESLDEKQDLMDDCSSDRVVIGGISPNKEVNDSSWSSETPTIQQLRYQENIERFFASQPKTYSDGSEDYSKIEKLSNVEDTQGIGCGFGRGKASSSKNQQSSQSSSQNYETRNKKSGSHSHAQKASTTTQTEDVMTTSEVQTQSIPPDFQAITTYQENPTSTSVTSSIPYPQGSSVPTQTPFYIPIMYMREMPFYPPAPNASSQ